MWKPISSWGLCSKFCSKNQLVFELCHVHFMSRVKCLLLDKMLLFKFPSHIQTYFEECPLFCACYRHYHYISITCKVVTSLIQIGHISKAEVSLKYSLLMRNYLVNSMTLFCWLSDYFSKHVHCFAPYQNPAENAKSNTAGAKPCWWQGWKQGCWNCSNCRK